MTDRAWAAGDRHEVVVTGAAVVTAAGRAPGDALATALAGTPTFTPVERFDVGQRRVKVGAILADATDLATELVHVIDRACAGAALTTTARAATPLLLAARVDSEVARRTGAERHGWSAATLAGAVAERCGLADPLRVYTAACVGGSSAAADAAAMLAGGRARRLVVAAGFLLDADHFAIFDAGRALAGDGQLRPFSATRRGMLLGDGFAAVVLETAESAGSRGAEVLGRLVGWGRAGDGYHICQPHPGGAGLARAVGSALARAGIRPEQVGYVNANGTGTPHSDAAESAGLHAALGASAASVPVSSTKSVHGHSLDASGLVELVLTVDTLRGGPLPVNAGFVAPDEQCRLNLVLRPGQRPTGRYALSVNSAFGGANTALVVAAG